MIHIGTTSPEYVTLFEHGRRFFERLIRARYAGARRRLARDLDASLAELDERILEDIGISRSIRDKARSDRFEMNSSMASRYGASAVERLARRR